MAQILNSDWARIYGDKDSGIWVAPKGTTLPTDLSMAFDPAFECIGWLNEDGIGFSVEKDVTDFNGYQGGGLVRRKVGKVTQKFTFTAWEESALVLSLVHADQEWTFSGTGADRIAKMNFAENQTRTVERAVIVDLQDGPYWKRYVLSALDVTFQGDVSHTNNEITGYSFEGAVIDGAVAELITNSPGVLAAAP